MALEKEALGRRLGLLCMAVYFCSYLTRINYGAVLVEMIDAEHFTKAAASLAVTCLSITYGIGQLVSGYLGDRLPPQKLIFWGILISAAANLLIPICPGTGLMTVVWSINGFAQAMMWPPIVKILSTYLEEEAYRTASVRVSWGSSFGTIFVYLITPVILVISSWRAVFVVSALCAIAMAFLWRSCYKKLQLAPIEKSVQQNTHSDAAASFTTLVLLLIGAIMIVIILQGILRDGITTWMPTYLSEIFQAENTVSIFSSIVLPIFSIGCYQLTAWLNKRYLKNELFCAGVIFAVGLAALMVLFFFRGSGMLVAVAAMAVAVAAMHGVNLMVICMVPNHFKRLGRTSLISGVLNSCTYVGSAVSTYGVALLSEGLGWDATVLIWIAVAILGTAACLLLWPAWKRFKEGT